MSKHKALVQVAIKINSP